MFRPPISAKLTAWRSRARAQGGSRRDRALALLRQAVSFALIGGLNTLLDLALMWLFYDVFHMGYWGSSATAFVLCSISSFVLNRRFTWRSTENVWRTLIRFSLVLAACYLLAYSLAQPLVSRLLQGRLDAAWQDRISMVTGMCLFTLMNFFGQRLIVFRKKREA